MTRRPLLLLALAGVAAGAAACSSGSAKPKTLPKKPPKEIAVVTLIGSGSNTGNGSEAVAVDLAGRIVSRPIPVGTFPAAVAVAPNGKTAYVANYSSNDVTPIDLRTGKAGKSIPAGPGPAGIAIAPNGKTAYVTDAGSSPIGTTVTPINLSTKKALPAITVGAGPQGIAITPDGSTAYVANAGGIVLGQTAPIGHTVTPIDLKSHKALAPIQVGNAPVSVAMSPDGSTVYVANTNSGSVTPISTGSNAAGTPISLEGSPQALATSSTTLWVADASSSVSQGNNLTPIDLATGSAGKPIPVPKGPTGLAISPDDGVAWVVSGSESRLVGVDLATGKIPARSSIPLSGGPYAVALASLPAGSPLPNAPVRATTTTKG